MLKNAMILSFMVFKAAGAAADSSSYNHTDFPLKSYRLPEIQYQSLTVSPGISWWGDWDLSNTNGGKSNYWREPNIANGAIYHVLRKRYVLSDVDMSTRGQFGFLIDPCRSSSAMDLYGNGIPIENANRSINRNFYYSVWNADRFRRYVKGPVFIEWSVAPSISHMPYATTRTTSCSIYRYYSTDTANYRYHKGKNSAHSVSLEASSHAGIGAGWIAEVTAAAAALHMLDKVESVDGKAPRLTREQIFRFAQYIDRFKRRRVFDGRVANIEDIDSLYTYLMKNGITDKETTRLTMELNDIWNYAFSQQRYSGREIKLFPAGSVAYYSSLGICQAELLDSIMAYDPTISTEDILGWPMMANSYSETEHLSLKYSYGMTFSAVFAKPLGRRHQLVASLLLSGVMEAREATNTDYSCHSIHPDTTRSYNSISFAYPKADGRLNVTYSYFPTLRTTVTLRNDFFGVKEFSYRFKRLDFDSSVSNPRSFDRTFHSAIMLSNLSMMYYISPQLSYTTGVECCVTKQRHLLYPVGPYNTERKWSSTWSARWAVSAYLIYAFF